jgi:putative phosphonate catabolism associated alcohol dehydrogenase
MDSIAPRLTRAAVWTGDGVEHRRVDVPRLGDGELLVHIDLATVCGSDLHTVTGRRPGACPSILGHEAVGHVVAVGGLAPVFGSSRERSSAAAVGDRIVWSVTVACGRCARCRAGRSAKCASVRKVGHESFDGEWALSGSYAEHIVLPAGTAVAHIPARIPDAVAAPAACATATVMATVEAAGDVTDRRVLVVGAGMLGVTAVAAYRDAGAQVLIADPDPDRVRVACRFGAVPDSGSSVDVAVDFSGAATAISAGLGRLDIGGRLVLAGSVMPGPPVPMDPEWVVRRWLTVTGVHNYEPRHLAAAVGLLDRTLDVHPWESLVEASVPLDDISQALNRPVRGLLRTSVRP